MDSCKSAREAYHYAKDFLNAPFPEGESVIAKDAGYSYRYARDILKSAFPLGEDAISKNSHFSYRYARDILKSAFPLGEDAIYTDEFNSYYYGKEVLNAPFPTHEKYKVPLCFSQQQLKVLLEANYYLFNGIADEDDEESEFESNKSDVAELIKMLEKVIKKSWQSFLMCYDTYVG